MKRRKVGFEIKGENGNDGSKLKVETEQTEQAEQ